MPEAPPESSPPRNSEQANRLPHPNLNACFDPELEAAPEPAFLERNRYFPRKLMTAEDMRLEQEYFRQKLRRHNRFLHGWGVVCGLHVGTPAARAQREPPPPPWQVVIGPGYALGPYGDEIYVPEAVSLDLAQCVAGSSAEPCELSPLPASVGAATTEPLYVAIRYAECNAGPVRPMPEGCACSEDACEFSRIRDGFEIRCLTVLPNSHRPDKPFDPCKNGIPNCPSCPEEPWVVLARITLPKSPSTTIAKGGSIEMAIRRHIHSTAVLQRRAS